MEGSLSELPTSTGLGFTWRCFKVCFAVNCAWAAWCWVFELAPAVCQTGLSVYLHWHFETSRGSWSKEAEFCHWWCWVRSCWPWLEKLAWSSCYHPKALQQVTPWYLFVSWFLCPLSGGVQPCCPSQRLTALVTFLPVFPNFSADLKLANCVKWDEKKRFIFSWFWIKIFKMSASLVRMLLQ